MTAPASLRLPDLAPVWQRVSDYLARGGLDRRGVIRIDEPRGTAALALRSLIGGSSLRSTRSIDLAALEAALARLGAGEDLPAALAELGFPVSTERLDRRAARHDAETARQQFREAVSTWPEPWAPVWADEVIRAGLIAGLQPREAVTVAEQVARVARGTDARRGGDSRSSRTEVAALEIGDAHALDPGTRLHNLVAKALERSFAEGDMWELAGMPADSLSAPVLTWGLPGPHPLLAAACQATVPVHLSAMLLRAQPVAMSGCPPVLAVENPRLVEAAAQRRHPAPVICTNGNPSTAVRLLMQQLLESRIEVLYHGDFDAAGLAICSRLHVAGLTPWRMTSEDYRDAVDRAGNAGVELPVDPSLAPPTPWEPTLQHTFDEFRRVVHQERLTDAVLAAHRDHC